VFNTLSESQRKIVFEKEGKFVVRACPGSGKTYSVAARLAHLISDWKQEHQGIAVISFTNAAWQEIQRQINNHFQIEGHIRHPHFLGTIDSFINHYIFLPFGHLIMGCNKRPVLVGEPHGSWSSGRYERDYDRYFDLVSFGARDEPVFPKINGLFHFGYTKFYKKDGTESKHSQNIRNVKTKFWDMGYATQRDANYFAMKILKKFPVVAKSITIRFPVLIIDEAQDTSEVQMEIIDYLIDNGLSNIMLVGDPDQAIFEWNDAKPQLFKDKMEKWSGNSIILNENRRSSQNICDCTCRLSSLEETSNAINDDVKECQFIPAVTIYKLEQITDIIDQFKSLCHDYDIEITPEKVAVIYRSKKFFNFITGIKEITPNEYPWHDDDPHCKDFAKGKYLFDNGEFKKSFDLILKAVIKKVDGSNYCSLKDVEKVVENYGFVKIRKDIFGIINLLHTTNYSVGDWVNGANNAFKDNNIKLELQIKNAGYNTSFNDHFGTINKQITETEYKLGTIHSVKGETFEAVLVMLKQKGIGSYYKTMLKNNVQIQDNEELRIVYVGITRPRKLLLLAVPDQENKSAWEGRLMN